MLAQHSLDPLVAFRGLAGALASELPDDRLLSAAAVGRCWQTSRQARRSSTSGGVFEGAASCPFVLREWFRTPSFAGVVYGTCFAAAFVKGDPSRQFIVTELSFVQFHGSVTRAGRRRHG